MWLRIFITSTRGFEKSFEFEKLFTAQDPILDVYILALYNKKSQATRH
jgi:hypothetical protein